MLSAYRTLVGSLKAQASLLGADNDSFKQSREAEIVHFKQMLTKTSVEPCEATLLYEEMSKPDSPFKEHERKHMGEAVATRMRSDAIGVDIGLLGDNDKGQECTHFYNYLSDKEWTGALKKKRFP